MKRYSTMLSEVVNIAVPFGFSLSFSSIYGETKRMDLLFGSIVFLLAAIFAVLCVPEMSIYKEKIRKKLFFVENVLWGIFSLWFSIKTLKEIFRDPAQIMYFFFFCFLFLFVVNVVEIFFWLEKNLPDDPGFIRKYLRRWKTW